MKKILALTALALLLASPAMFAQSGATTATSSLAISVGAEAGIQVTANPSFNTPVNFANYTGNTTFTYWIRTGTSGNPQITVYISTDFSNGSNNQPSVASPPNAGDTLSYSCAMTNPQVGTVTACTGSQTATTVQGSATNVATFGKSTSSAKAGATGNTVSWTLVNDPVYPVGSYTAVATFTISAA